ncbi:prevent-host-death protein [Weissella confusa]|uniref:prevent-host-death protein n=1 Tax=Weissella confusa TaxID=1583 RepID=UPI00223B9DF6|nr:prevent-host-death protein [Weissella confusa]MCT0947883.1 prevent-host-death protein [Weissella confusa]
MKKLTVDFAQAHLFDLLRDVTERKVVYEIETDEQESVVMLPTSEYNRMKEALYLGENNVLRTVISRMETAIDADFEEI